MSDILPTNFDWGPDRDIDYAKRFRAVGYHSCWNHLLKAIGRPLRCDGWNSIIAPLPRGFPDPDDFDRLDLDVSWLYLLQEFSHWKDSRLGGEFFGRDMYLLDTGRMSLLNLFRRGPVNCEWYDRLWEAKPDLRREYLEAARKEVIRQIEQLEDDFMRHDGQPGSTEILRSLRHCELAIRTALDADEAPSHSYKQADRRSTLHLQRPSRIIHKPRAASDGDLDYPSRPSRMHNTPISPRTTPRVQHAYAPSPTMNMHQHAPSPSQTKARPAFGERMEEYDAEFKRIQARSRALRRSHSRHDRTGAGHTPRAIGLNAVPCVPLYHSPSEIRCSPSLDTMERFCQRVGLDTGEVVSLLRKDTEELEQLAWEYRKRYETIRAQIEGSDKFAPGAGDVMRSKWDREDLEKYLEKERAGDI